MKIVFIGTPKFASIILEKLIENKYKPVLVITETDKPSGRKQEVIPSEVKQTAEKNNISVIQPEKIKDAEEELKKINPDLIVLTAYGQIVPKSVLDIPRFGSINIHPSLLPKYRGASPVQSTILNGDKITGVTIYQMDEKMDHGAILMQRELEIKDNPTCEELKEILANFGANLLNETLPKIENQEIVPELQNEDEATYTKLIKKENGHIVWDNSAHNIERQIRAYNSWPTSFTFWQKDGTNAVRIKLIKVNVKNLPNDKNYPVGKVVLSPENELLIVCRDNFLNVLELQLEGKKSVSAAEFLKGRGDIVGNVLK